MFAEKHNQLITTIRPVNRPLLGVTTDVGQVLPKVHFC